MKRQNIKENEVINLESEDLEIKGDVPQGVSIHVFDGNIIIHGSVGENVMIAVGSASKISETQDVYHTGNVTIQGSIHATTNVCAMGVVSVSGKKMMALKRPGTITSISPQTVQSFLRAEGYYENIFLLNQLLPIAKDEMFYAMGDTIPSSPVIDAIKAGYMGYLSILIETGANLSFERNNGETALNVALRQGHILAVSWILDGIKRGHCTIPLSQSLREDAEDGCCEEAFLGLLSEKGLQFVEMMNVSEQANEAGFRVGAAMLSSFEEFLDVASIRPDVAFEEASTAVSVLDRGRAYR